MRQHGARQTRARRWIVPVAGMLVVLATLGPSVLRPSPAFAASGSIASFIGLSVAMFLTRDIDWYGGRAEEAAPAKTPA